jgi:hypothetical protein
MTRIEYLKLLSKGYKDSGLVVPAWIDEERRAYAQAVLGGNVPPLAEWQQNMAVKFLENPDTRWVWHIPRMSGKQRIIDITNC